MEVRLLQAYDITDNRMEMVRLMELVLRDNILQNYPDDLAEQYVLKIPGYIEDGSAIVAGAFEEGVLVGFSWAYELSIFDERRVHIDMIGVNPDFRGRGIARRLVDIQIEETQKRGISIMEAMTTKDNVHSYNWFHSIGFQDERVKVRRNLG